MADDTLNKKLEDVECHMSKIEEINNYPIYNLMSRIKIPRDINPTFYTIYHPIKNESFQSISYKSYGTISLWWLICLVNNLYNITEGATPEIPLKIIKQQYIGDILEEL